MTNGMIRKCGATRTRAGGMNFKWRWAMASVICLFAGVEARPDDVLRHEMVVEAPVEAVWAAFTSQRGIESWMVPHAEVDLRIGGTIRTIYSESGAIGDPGTIEQEILSFEPNRMISMRVAKAPANFPFKGSIANTWSVLRMVPLGPTRTRLVVSGMGYRQDEQSQKMRAFFDRANEWTLEQLRERFAHTTWSEDGAMEGPLPGRKMTSRKLRKQVIVDAPVDVVWNAWTTTAGIESFFCKKAKVELTTGGAFEMYFKPDNPYGERGAEYCNVLAYIPHELFAFDWTASPAVPGLRLSRAKTQVILQFEPISKSRTRIDFTQLGFGEGTEWDEYYAYFDEAWAKVLGWAQDKIKGSSTRSLTPDKTWQDGATTVTVYSTVAKRQDFEVVVPATPQEVWRVLTTVEGVRTFYPTQPVIEMRPGGVWDLHGGAPNKVLAFIPHEMLAVTGSAPLEFPEVRKGGTVGVLRITKVDDKKTRLLLTSVGWQDGEEWDRAFDYFLKANAQFMNMLHDRFVNGPKKFEKTANASSE